MPYLVDVPPSLMRDDLERREPLNSRRFVDLTGKVSERCTVIGLAGFLKAYSTWLCDCQCGNQFIIRANQFRDRNPTCGCGGKTHGLSKTHIYGVYVSMKGRCYNPNDASYHNYGGRGIKVCQKWLDSPEAFARDMGPRPSPEHSIDRYPNNDGDYEPGNCRWATVQEQNSNMRKTRWIEHNGERLYMSQWAERVGVSNERMRQRLNICELLGVDHSEAVATPAGERMPCMASRRVERTEKMVATKEERLARRNSKGHAINSLLDGEVHYLLKDDLVQLAGQSFDTYLRNACAYCGLTAHLRQLSGHILFQAK